jgi:hypothetical protein
MTRRHLPLGIALGLALGLVTAGCGGASDSLPRQAISGKVTLDGKPLPSGSISFDPDDPGQPNPVSVGATIIDGVYSLPRAEGPTPGIYRVSINAVSESEPVTNREAPGAPPKKRPKDLIPAKYNAKTTLKATVTAGGSNSFDYELTSQ